VLVTLTEAELNISAACAVLLPTVSTLVMAPLTLTTFAETEARLLAISCAPFACCSTAEAMRTEKPFSSWIVRDIRAMASTERRVTFWIASMRLLMRGLCGLAEERLDLLRHDGKSAAGFTGARPRSSH
jgi:hypothetical protein